MPKRKIGRILDELEEALIQEGVSEDAASEYLDGVEEEIDDLLADQDTESSESGQETS